MTDRRARLRRILGVALFLFLATVPLYAATAGDTFYLSFFARIMIFAIAAISLDIILGYGGMVSFGHSAFLGIGAYAVGILSAHGIDSLWVQWPVGIVASAAIAAVIGAISLRTSGVYFIMITLAFAQMLYFLAVSLKNYGGDDGLPIPTRSQVGGLVDLGNPYLFYYLVFGLLLLFLWVGHRLVASRFGMVLRGTKSNLRRMRAIGFPSYRYQLAAFVLSGTMCGIAGLLLGNLTNFVSPAYMHWSRSGELIVMVILGGMGTLTGSVFGAFAFLLLEELLASWTTHWMVILGPIFVLIVLFARRGIYGLLLPRDAVVRAHG